MARRVLLVLPARTVLTGAVIPAPPHTAKMAVLAVMVVTVVMAETVDLL